MLMLGFLSGFLLGCTISVWIVWVYKADLYNIHEKLDLLLNSLNALRMKL